MNAIPLLTPVATTQDVPDHKLTRGQIGTVVEYLDREGEKALLVEFSDEQGQTYACVALRSDQLMPLHRNIDAA